jgi:hypothetical protein
MPFKRLTVVGTSSGGSNNAVGGILGHTACDNGVDRKHIADQEEQTINLHTLT